MCSLINSIYDLINWDGTSPAILNTNITVVDTDNLPITIGSGGHFAGNGHTITINVGGDFNGIFDLQGGAINRIFINVTSGNLTANNGWLLSYNAISGSLGSVSKISVKNIGGTMEAGSGGVCGNNCGGTTTAFSVWQTLYEGIVPNNGGGICSKYFNGSVNASYVISSSIGQNAGGIVGSDSLSTGIIFNCAMYGILTGSGAGGFAGASSACIIHNSYSLANLNDQSNVGGFVGNNSTSQLTNIYYLNTSTYSNSNGSYNIAGGSSSNSGLTITRCATNAALAASGYTNGGNNITNYTATTSNTTAPISLFENDKWDFTFTPPLPINLLGMYSGFLNYTSYNSIPKFAPVYIYKQSDLALFNPLHGAPIVFQNDITITDTSYLPIDTIYGIDGNGYTLTINVDGAFPGFANGDELNYITNLNVNVISGVLDEYCGWLVTRSWGGIYFSNVNVTNTGSATFAGGNSIFFGGPLNSDLKSIHLNCTYEGPVSTNGGVFTAYNNGNTYGNTIIKNCFVNASSIGQNGGGFVGPDSWGIIITSSYVKGTLSGASSGGFAGNNCKCHITDCYSLINMNNQNTSGGFMGNSSIGSITTSYYLGSGTMGTDSYTFIGGTSSSSLTITNCASNSTLGSGYANGGGNITYYTSSTSNATSPITSFGSSWNKNTTPPTIAAFFTGIWNGYSIYNQNPNIIFGALSLSSNVNYVYNNGKNINGIKFGTTIANKQNVPNIIQKTLYPAIGNISDETYIGTVTSGGISSGTIIMITPHIPVRAHHLVQITADITILINIGSYLSKRFIINADMFGNPATMIGSTYNSIYSNGDISSYINDNDIDFGITYFSAEGENQFYISVTPHAAISTSIDILCNITCKGYSHS